MPTNAPDIQTRSADRAEHIHFDWGELIWYANHALGNSDQMTIGQCVLKPGCQNPRHCHPNCTEVLVVAEGRIRHTAPNGGDVELGVGDTVTIPPNVWHRALNVGAEPAVLLIAFSSGDRQTIGEDDE